MEEILKSKLGKKDSNQGVKRKQKEIEKQKGKEISKEIEPNFL